MPRYTLRTLGTLGLEKPGGWVRLDRESLGLLCLLRLSPNASITRANAISLLWPPNINRAPRLDACIAAINSATGIRIVDADADTVRLEPDTLACDVEPIPEGTARREDRFLSGFSLPASPAFRQWAEARRATVRAAPGIAPPQKRLPIEGAAAMGALGLIGVMAVYATRSTPPPGFTPGDPVAVVAADDAPLTLAFGAAALRTLGRSGYLAPFDATGAPDRPEITLTLAALAGGEAPRFRAVLTSASGDTIAADSAAGSGRGALTAMDDLFDRIRARLGERPTERHRGTAPLERAGTGSLEALAAWAAGNRALALGDRPTARKLWVDALRHDSTFAWANLSLADDAIGRNDEAAAARHYRAALSQAGRLSPGERARAEASLQGSPPP